MEEILSGMSGISPAVIFIGVLVIGFMLYFILDIITTTIIIFVVLSLLTVGLFMSYKTEMDEFCQSYGYSTVESAGVSEGFARIADLYIKLEKYASDAGIEFYPNGGGCHALLLSYVGRSVIQNKNSSDSDMKKAFNNLTSSLDIAKKSGDDSAVANALGGLGEFYGMTGDVSQACKALSMSMSVYSSLSTDAKSKANLTELQNMLSTYGCK